MSTVGTKRITYSLQSYLQEVEDRDIRPDSETQRKYKRRSSEWQDKLIKTVLSRKFNYIPDIQLAEENTGDSKVLYILNGLHRTMSLMEFWKGIHRISKSMKDSKITYLRKRTDDNGDCIVDNHGGYVTDEVEFDLKGKKFDDLPPELQKMFNNYQLSTVVFENCSKEEQAEWVIILNEQNAMTAAQKAFTYTSKFAKTIRNITDESRFFKDCGRYTQTERENGTIERIVSECVMASFYLDNWNKNSKQNGIFLNQNATDDDFNKISSYLDRLIPLCENDLSGEIRYKGYFNSKNTFIFISLFDRFSKLKLSDSRFRDFLTELEGSLHSKAIDDVSYDELDGMTGTKDKKLVTRKINHLERLMKDYLGYVEEKFTTDIDFISEVTNLNEEQVAVNLSDYKEDLDDVLLNTIKDGSSELLDRENYQSLLAMIVYAYDHDLDFENWIKDYSNRNHTYLRNQRKNFYYMVNDIKQFSARGIGG